MREKLTAIQMLRALAAVGVVLHHVSGQIRTNLGTVPALSLEGPGARGVELFFVISGFIIFYAHAHQLGQPKFVGSYIIRRLKRILPSTILVSTVWILVILAAAQLGIPGPDVSFGTWLSSAFVLPMLERTQPGVIWTLRNEFVFYLFFSTFLINVRLGTVVFLAWVTTCFFIPTPNDLVDLEDGIVFNTVFADLNVIFLFGLLAFLAYRHAPRPRVRPLFMPLSLLFAMIAYWNTAWAPVPEVVFGIVGGLLIYVAAHVRWEGALAKAIELLGDASYAIYLVHIPTIAILYPVLSKLVPQAEVLYGLEAVIAVAVGVGFYKLFEKPVAVFFAKRRAAMA